MFAGTGNSKEMEEQRNGRTVLYVWKVLVVRDLAFSDCLSSSASFFCAVALDHSFVPILFFFPGLVRIFDFDK